MPIDNSGQRPHMRRAPRDMKQPATGRPQRPAARRASPDAYRGAHAAPSAGTRAPVRLAGARGTGAAHGSRAGSRRVPARSGAAPASRRSPVRTLLPVLAAVLVIGVVGFAGWSAVRAIGGLLGGTAGKGTSADVATVKDKEAAGAGDIVIGVNGDADTYVLVGEEYVEGGAHAAEPTDGVLTPKIEVSGKVDTSKKGDYKVTYSVDDSSGHTATATRTVHVVDSMDTMQGDVPVLMYHYIYDVANPPEKVDANYLASDAFEQQLDYLTKNDFYFPSFAEIKAFVEGKHSLPAKSVVLTFDDGEQGFLNVGVPLLERYKVPATSFIIAVDDDAVQKVVEHRSAYVEYESHSYNMHRAGGNVGHGGIISAMTQDQIVEDLKKSQEITGGTHAFAYPFGDTTDTAKAAVEEAGIECAFTTVNARAKVGDDARALPRVRISGGYSLESYVSLVS